MKSVLLILSIALLAGFASATTVDFDSYSPTNTCLATVSSGGLDFNTGGFCMGVWTGNPNGNGTPSLIYTDFGGGRSVTMSLTGGGTFTLNSADLTISWYDNNTSDTILVNGNPITLFQGLQTYNLNLTNVTSVTFSELSSGTGYWLMDNVVYNGGTTPEPGTLALLGSGMLAGLGVLRRKVRL